MTPARVVGHCVTQCFFDGRWNLFDGDMHSMYLLRDNRTVACEQDLVRDHDLIKRSHTQGILNPDKRANDEWEASIYLFEGPPDGRSQRAPGHHHEHGAAARRGDHLALGPRRSR